MVNYSAKYVSKKNIMSPEISIVVPLYNEVEVFEELIQRLNKVIEKSNLIIEVVLIDDGSNDGTKNLMSNLGFKNSNYTCVFLSKNFGHQNAVTAGLELAKASSAIFIIDGDLQDPPELLKPFYEKLKQGYDVIYGIRKKRKEIFYKKFLYWLFYRIMNLIAETNIQMDSGDFALISRRVVDQINKMPEKSRFIRGLRSWVGFKQYGFEYERDKRAAGEPKYTFKALFQLAYNGIYNFSTIPIRLIYKLGITTMLLTFTYIIFLIINKIFFGNVPKGYTSIILIISIFSSVQLISIGVLGEYLIRIHKQSQNRPLFIIENIIRDKSLKNG